MAPLRFEMPAVLLLFSACQCAPGMETPERPIDPPGSRGCAPGVERLPARMQQGICYAHSYEDGGGRGYGSETSARSLQELRRLGVEWVSLTPFGFMSAADATEVRHVGSHRGGESDEVMRAELRRSRALGLKRMLKPHLWIRGGTWCGRIDPGSDDGWDRFFESYRQWLLGYARMAAEEDVEVLAIGVELGTATARAPERFRALAAEVRAIYGGRILYAANWDEVERIPFWDALDFIGVQFYAPLAAVDGAPDDALRRRLADHLDAIGRVAERAGRPVLFTEVGYKSIHGTEVHPHTWPEHHAAPVVDAAAQSRAYRIFLDGIRERPFVAGVYFWKWFTDPDTGEEGPGGFSPRGKPAEAVLGAAYGGRCGSVVQRAP